MTNWINTTAYISGPEEDIDRMKADCFFLKPQRCRWGSGPNDNGIDVERIIPKPEGIPDVSERNRRNWGSTAAPVWSTYGYEDGKHYLTFLTAGGAPVPVFQRIVQMFPSLTFTFYAGDYMTGFEKGTVSAAGTIREPDEEAERSVYEERMEASNDYDAEMEKRVQRKTR